jgi:transcriptional regulator with GAF, ATPase, and Fis domain
MNQRSGADDGGATTMPATTVPSHVERLTATFVELADTLVDDFDLIEFLYMLVQRCVELVDVSAVGLMVTDGQGRLQVMASSTEETRLLELFQLQNGEGPCLQCFRTGRPVQDPDLSLAAHRWPLFAPEAVRAGFRTVHALPMRLRTRTIGALNLFHVQANAFAEADIRIAQALVDVATVGLIQVDMGRRQEVLVEQLEAALHMRIAIEQAKGVLAEVLRISPAEAFGVLRVHAAEHNHRLTELVHAVLERAPIAAELLAGTTETPERAARPGSGSAG